MANTIDRPVCCVPKDNALRPMNVAVVDEELPYPLVTGKRIRTYNLLMRLAKRHHITFICHRNPDPDELCQAKEQFDSIGIAYQFIDRPLPGRSVSNGGLTLCARLGWNLLSADPYLVQVNASRQLRRAIQRHAQRGNVDVWHCEWTPLAAAFRGFPLGPFVVVAHNVESLIWARYYETEANPAKRWYIHNQWQKFIRFEQAAFARSSRVIAVSSADAELVRSDFCCDRLSVVDNGVDFDYFQPRDAERNSKEILFLGSLDWRPNLDAVRLLIGQIMPRVWAVEPAARLTIVGRTPPAWLVARARQSPNVELHSTVPDVRPYLGRCGLMAVPLRIGGGTRLKILEALATNTPVVSTRVGAEGLELEPGRDFIQVETADEMAHALIDGVRNPQRLQAMARRGREAVLGKYSWDVLADQLERAWHDSLAHDPSVAAR
jgi:glycosyltransferase involved in cell wall biosynthesis